MNNFKLINKANSPENLVIFIHGFTGTDDTWEKGKERYPLIENILESNIIFQNYNIAVFKYASKRILNEKPNSINKRFGTELLRQTPFIKKLFNADKEYNQPISVIADILTTHIQGYVATRELKQLNIYFVAHSMGGLVSKKFILDNLTHSVFNVVQFHSIHVPHCGSEFAGILNNKVDNVQAKDLETTSDLIHELNSLWLKNTDKGLPFTYYYVGHSDSVVGKNSAKSYEHRTENVMTLNSNLRHSNFLEFIDNNIVLDWIKIGLENSLKEKVRNEKLKVEQKLERIALETVEANKELERLYPKCMEYNCLEYKSVELINKIEKYLSLYTEITDENKSQIKVEIKYLLKIIRLFLVNPNLPIDDIATDMPELSKLCQIETVLDFVEEKVLHSCTCETKSQFENFLSKVKIEVELSTC